VFKGNIVEQGEKLMTTLKAEVMSLWWLLAGSVY